MKITSAVWVSLIALLVAFQASTALASDTFQPNSSGLLAANQPGFFSYTCRRTGVTTTVPVAPIPSTALIQTSDPSTNTVLVLPSTTVVTTNQSVTTTGTNIGTGQATFSTQQQYVIPSAVLFPGTTTVVPSGSSSTYINPYIQPINPTTVSPGSSTTIPNNYCLGVSCPNH